MSHGYGRSSVCVLSCINKLYDLEKCLPQYLQMYSFFFRFVVIGFWFECELDVFEWTGGLNVLGSSILFLFSILVFDLFSTVLGESEFVEQVEADDDDELDEHVESEFKWINGKLKLWFVIDELFPLNELKNK